MSGAEDLKFESSRKFKIRWSIRNFSMFGAKEDNSLISKTVVVPSLDNSEWYLKILSKGPKEKAMCFLCRTDNGPSTIKVFYAISVDSSYAVEFQSMGKKSFSIMPGAINQDKFISNVSKGLCKDVLHVECHLWPVIDSGPQNNTALVSPYPVSISMNTEIVVENRSCFYKIKNFSNLPQNEMVNISLASAGYGGIKLICRFWLEEQNLKMILREPEDSAQAQLFVLNCKIHFVDIFKKRHLVCSERAVFNSQGDGSDKTKTFTLSLPRKELIEKKDLYLGPDDVLLLYCNIDVGGMSSVNLIESTIYDTSDAQNMNHDFEWGMYLENKYNENRFLFRFLAILVVVLSILPHLLVDNTAV